jgi:NADH dehydrogenase [ubiquinone] 1 alpha subcomplex assembly factor 7
VAERADAALWDLPRLARQADRAALGRESHHRETVSDTLAETLRSRIAERGFITVAEYMELVLGAYYADRDPLGRGGDFITAPEVSQMFGEMIGLWCVDLWSRMGKPDPMLLVELGPGRGTLMADALRAAKRAPDFLKAAEIHLVEVNAKLITAQKAVLAGFAPAWHRTFDSLPSGPMILIANEFWDALPIHQFVMTEQGWRERTVVLRDGKLAFDHADVADAGDLIRPAHRSATPGQIAEVSPAGQRLAAAMARRLARHAGAALIIDYGPMQSGLGDSLQALKGHRHHDPLLEPGAADLTSHVDFAALADAARTAGAAVFGPTTQGAFLQALGIKVRADALKANQDAATRAEIDAGLQRLIGDGGMGSLFKVMAIASPNAPHPAGL